MSLKKKIILGVVIALVTLATVGGIVVANTDTGTTTTAPVTTNPQDTLLEKVAAKLGITVDSLKTAFQEARSEIRQERLDTWLAQLVTDGKITQEQADAYKKWLNSRPSDQEYQDALQTWRDANPLAGLDLQLPGTENNREFGMPGRIGPIGGGFECPQGR
ncbi:MAG: hypothetical protein JW967_00850 [Dehalococcoidales bacterium]|nr:hypothetical protein [Dehalococcoidales bacterium]